MFLFPLNALTVFNVLPYLPDGFHTVFNVSLARFAMRHLGPVVACGRKHGKPSEHLSERSGIH